MSNRCKLALVSDSEALRASDEYIANMAQAKRLNVRAFRSESVALRWLRRSPDSSSGPSDWTRRYKFSRNVIAGAPEEPGVYALWHGEELIYYGRAFDGATSTLAPARALPRQAGSNALQLGDVAGADRSRRAVAARVSGKLRPPAAAQFSVGLGLFHFRKP
jgi:hypothetical protein